MASQVDDTVPVHGNPTTASVRDNFSVIKSEITAIQSFIDGLGTAAHLDVPVSGNASTTQVVKGDDTRLTNSRTPTAHTHVSTEIVDSTIIGRSLLTSDDAAAVRAVLSVPSGSGTSTGTNTGDQISVTGNAGTATALQTARTIDGQPFDGTANITVIAPGTFAATSKSTPVDADALPITDSAASNTLKKLTWANVKATLKTYFDTLYQAAFGAGFTWDAANKTLTIGGGSPTTSKPVINATQTWTQSGVAYDADLANITDTASAAASTVWRRKVNGVDVGSLTKAGVLTTNKLVVSASSYSLAPFLDIGSSLNPPASPTPLVIGPNGYTLLGLFGGGGPYIAGAPYVSIGDPGYGSIHGYSKYSLGYQAVPLCSVIGPTYSAIQVLHAVKPQAASQSADWYQAQTVGEVPFFSVGTVGVKLASSKALTWSSGSSTDDALLAGIAQTTGVVEVNNGSAGNYRDLKLRSLIATDVITLGNKTVATLPSVASSAHAIVAVTDATSATYRAALAGGGSIKCLAYCDGSNPWMAH